MTVTSTIPQHEGEYTPEEARAWTQAQLLEKNLAGSKGLAGERSERALKFIQSVMVEWTENLQPLHRRWRATNYMLSGNTLEKGGPEDVHVPEIYKALETLIPRIEEVILEKDPWFRIVPRKRSERATAEANEAYLDWQFDQAKIRSMIQPALRDMLITQSATWYVWWDHRITERNVREIVKGFDDEGKPTRKVKITRKPVIDYSGPSARLVDPFDFIIDPKATDPQNAIFVGHRAWLTIEEIRRLGKEQGWTNLDELKVEGSTHLGVEIDHYRWTRDPTAHYGGRERDRLPKNDGRPDKMEIVFLNARYSVDGDDNYEDYRMVVAGGQHCLDLRVNPLDGQYRPYANMRSTKSGHEFFGTGTFDNAIRLNQHLDRYHQIFLRGAAVSANPIVFAEEDSDLPDNLYRVTPFKVFKGTGPVRFTSIPDGFLKSAPMVIGELRSNIEEVVGSFRIQMGQQDSGGTATEATLSIQEGNRRTRGLIRSFGDGLEQLMTIFHRLNLQFSIEDVEFPVLGKRALDLHRDYVNMGPADLLDDVRFELVGLSSLRTYGLKSTGLMSFVNAMTPFIVGNPQSVDQVGLMYEMARELIGVEEADRLIKVPTSPDRLRSQEEENEGLIQGAEIEVNPDDDHEDHMEKMEHLYRRALVGDDMSPHMRGIIVEHYLQHEAYAQKQEAEQRSLRKRQMQEQPPPEAGGTQPAEQGAPQAGGFSAQMQGGPGGQTQGENPGPADQGKYGRSGRDGRTINQTENQV